MAYKWVDETKLNAALTASADAIREKTGDTAQINFDMENETGFESAIEEIESGGGIDHISLLRSAAFSGAAILDGDILDFRNAETLDTTFRYAGLSKDITLLISDKLTNARELLRGTSGTITIIGTTKNVTNFQGFAKVGARTIRGTSIDFSSAEIVSELFSYGNYGLDARFEPNTLSINAANTWTGNNYGFANDDSLVSYANCLKEGIQGATVYLVTSDIARCNTILGTVSADATGIFHIFTEDVGGTVTLTDFITNTKGWTIA